MTQQALQRSTGGLAGAGISLSEFIGQANRGGPLGSLLGQNFLSKADGTFLGIDTTAGNITGDIFTATFGRRIWHALNNQARVFNAIPRVEYGNVAGWRVRTDRGNQRTSPILESGPLPTPDVSNIATVQALPRIIGTTFGVTTLSTFVSQLEGGAGDILAAEMENSQIDHIKGINQQLLASSGCRVAAATGANADAYHFVVPANYGNHFNIGDHVGHYDLSATAHLSDPVGALSTGGFPITAIAQQADGTFLITIGDEIGVVGGSSAVFADGDVVYILDRAGFTSFSDITQVENGGMGGGESRVQVYNLNARTAGSWKAAVNDPWNNGVGRSLTLPLLDNVFRDIRINGGEPKIIIMGHDQYYRLERLLQAQQRYVGYEEYQVGVGREKTFPGTRSGMMLSTYQGIPILPEPDMPRSVSSTGSVLGSDIIVLDTDYVEFGVALPTSYVENRDVFAANQLVVRGLFYTIGELRVRNLWVQGRIADLSE